MSANAAPPRNEQPSRREPSRREQANLSGQYGEIGIASVAAAARYTGKSEDRASRKDSSYIDSRFIEAAA